MVIIACSNYIGPLLNEHMFYAVLCRVPTVMIMGTLTLTLLCNELFYLLRILRPHSSLHVMNAYTPSFFLIYWLKGLIWKWYHMSSKNPKKSDLVWNTIINKPKKTYDWILENPNKVVWVVLCLPWDKMLYYTVAANPMKSVMAPLYLMKKTAIHLLVLKMP